MSVLLLLLLPLACGSVLRALRSSLLIPLVLPPVCCLAVNPVDCFVAAVVVVEGG